MCRLPRPATLHGALHGSAKFLLVLFGIGSAAAGAQDEARLAAPVFDTAAGVAASPVVLGELLDRVGTMERRLDQVTKQNEDLRRENKSLLGRPQNPPIEIAESPPLAASPDGPD